MITNEILQYFSFKVTVMLRSSSRVYWMDAAGGRSSLAISYVETGIGDVDVRRLGGSLPPTAKAQFFHSLAASAWLSPSHSYLGIATRAIVCHMPLRSLVPISTQILLQTHVTSWCSSTLLLVPVSCPATPDQQA